MTRLHPDSDSDALVGTRWRRINGKERVEVRRVWFWPDQGWTVRAHPIRGGKVLVADLDWFVEHYAEETLVPESPVTP